MLNIRELEDLRTKEELINYFKAKGKNITEEEIAALKRNYEQAEENGNILTMQQLDSVAGGGGEFHLTFLTSENKFKLDKVGSTSDALWHVKLKVDAEQDYKDIGTADGRLVLYALNLFNPFYKNCFVSFTNKPNRLNEFQTQAEDFIEKITDIESFDNIYSPYLKTKYNILEAIITQAYPQLKEDILNKKIAILIPAWNDPNAVRISDRDGTLNICDCSKHVFEDEFPLYRISEEWLPK